MEKALHDGNIKEVYGTIWNATHDVLLAEWEQLLATYYKKERIYLSNKEKIEVVK